MLTVYLVGLGGITGSVTVPSSDKCLLHRFRELFNHLEKPISEGILFPTLIPVFCPWSSVCRLIYPRIIQTPVFNKCETLPFMKEVEYRGPSFTFFPSCPLHLRTVKPQVYGLFITNRQYGVVLSGSTLLPLFFIKIYSLLPS